MALEINWPTFDKKTMEEYKAQLTKIMNQGPFPPQICDAITVTILDVGKIVRMLILYLLCYVCMNDSILSSAP